jgi:catalase
MQKLFSFSRAIGTLSARRCRCTLGTSSGREQLLTTWQPFRIFTAGEQDRLLWNTARALGDASQTVKQRHVGNCAKADAAYGLGVAKALSQCSREARHQTGSLINLGGS